MILHTLVFSFGDQRTPEQRDEFLAQIKEICLGSGLTQHVATGVHKPAAEDQYAPVFVSSAIAQLLCENMETLGQLSTYEPLVAAAEALRPRRQHASASARARSAARAACWHCARHLLLPWDSTGRAHPLQLPPAHQGKRQ